MRNLRNVTMNQIEEFFMAAPEADFEKAPVSAEKIEVVGVFTPKTQEAQEALELQMPEFDGAGIEEDTTTCEPTAWYSRDTFLAELFRFLSKRKGDLIEDERTLGTYLGVEPNWFRNTYVFSGLNLQGGRGERILISKADEMFGELRRVASNMELVMQYGFSLVGENEDETAPWRHSYPALRSIALRALSGRGANSPATGKALPEYKGFFNNSVAKVERTIWAVKETALTKHNIKISFELALEAISIVGVRAVSKAATVAFALKLGAYVRSYRDARDFVVSYLTAKSNDDVKVIDGVESFGHVKVFEKGAITGFSCFVKEVWDRKPHYAPGFVFVHKVEGSYHEQNNNNKYSLERALQAFKERKAQRLSQLEIEAAIAQESGVLVYLQDSYNAGNCVAGTEDWMRNQGFSGQKLVPLYKVYEAAISSNNQLAMNVVKKVVAEVLSVA